MTWQRMEATRAPSLACVRGPLGRMARPLQFFLSLGLTFYALSRMDKVFDAMWLRREHFCPSPAAKRPYDRRSRARRGREQRREQRERLEAEKLRQRLLDELAARQGGLGH